MRGEEQWASEKKREPSQSQARAGEWVGHDHSSALARMAWWLVGGGRGEVSASASVTER